MFNFPVGAMLESFKLPFQEAVEKWTSHPPCCSTLPFSVITELQLSSLSHTTASH